MLQPKEIKFSLAQMALLRAKQFEARGAFIVTNALLLVILFFTTMRFPHKFVRVVGSCESNWVLPEEPGRVLCCSSETTQLSAVAPCYRGMTLSPVLSSLQGAWVLPLVALIANYVAMILGPRASIERVRVLVRRALLYLSVMLFRTLVLYMGLGTLERLLVDQFLSSSSSSSVASDHCWYSHLRRNKRCASSFDHSDHIVLLVSHYGAITLFEWFALNVELPMPSRQSLKKTMLQGWMLALGAVVTYVLFFTTSFFHSPAENVVGMLVGQGLVMLPLFLLSQDYFTGSRFFRLKNFVLPPPIDGAAFSSSSSTTTGSDSDVTAASAKDEPVCLKTD